MIGSDSEAPMSNDDLRARIYSLKKLLGASMMDYITFHTLFLRNQRPTPFISTALDLLRAFNVTIKREYRDQMKQVSILLINT